LIVHARKAWLSGLSPKENRELPPLDYGRVHRLKRDYPAIEIVVNGGLTDAASAAAELAYVDGVMLGRAAYHEPMLLAKLDRLLWEPTRRLPIEELRHAALRAYCRYIDAELRAGTPLKAMTRHLLGIYAGERGGRKWRRALGELANGAAGLDELRAVIRENANAGESLRAGPAAFAAPAFPSI
jgi:tRNA-dihydrouridine synthase A